MRRFCSGTGKARMPGMPARLRRRRFCTSLMVPRSWRSRRGLSCTKIEPRLSVGLKRRLLHVGVDVEHVGIGADALGDDALPVEHGLEGDVGRGLRAHDDDAGVLGRQEALLDDAEGVDRGHDGAERDQQHQPRAPERRIERDAIAARHQVVAALEGARQQPGLGLLAVVMLEHARGTASASA